jgi:thiol-disulfide isomerase/thioredoxin
MKCIVTFSFVLFFVTKIFSQNDPVPDYVTAQDFPDSVKILLIEDLAGKRITFGQMLASYKGKKVLIDIWGSWCRDCIVGYPKLEELRKHVGEKNIAYVFLSADKDKQKWKNAISKYNIRGDHYILDGAWVNSLSHYLVLDWVPRYLVLDENGRVIMAKAIVADNKVLKKALQ